MLEARTRPEVKIKCEQAKCSAMYPPKGSSTVYEDWEESQMRKDADLKGWRFGRTLEAPVYGYRCKKHSTQLSTIARDVSRMMMRG